VALKDNIGYVKEELSGDEKVLESVLKAETFYKKYKRVIWGILIAIVVIFAGKAMMDLIHDSRMNSANEALLALQKDPKNSEALEELKSKNPALFELYSYHMAVEAKDAKRLQELAGSKNPLIADISTYTEKVLASQSSDSVYYKEMSLIEAAYLAIKAGKPDEARSKLELIDARSPVAQVAELLKHYTIKGK
jgi:hypothetical protein